MDIDRNQMIWHCESGDLRVTPNVTEALLHTLRPAASGACHAFQAGPPI